MARSRKKLSRETLSHASKMSVQRRIDIPWTKIFFALQNTWHKTWILSFDKLPRWTNRVFQRDNLSSSRYQRIGKQRVKVVRT